MKKIFFVLFLIYPVAVFAKFDPSFKWNTIETEHFQIHFHQGEELVARKAAVISEDIHKKLAPRIKWEPKQKTNVVLVDSFDGANGSATVYPYNIIKVYVTQPSAMQFGSYDDWLRMLITHEYTHILQMDMVSGIPEKIQNIFGRIYFPNLFQPVWMLEGLATYEETEQTQGGRGRSAVTDMIIRMAVLEGRFPGLDQMAHLPDTWPSVQVPYDFGESFIRYIAGKYGRDKYADVSTAYSGRGFPFLVNSTGERILNQSYETLWNEWKSTLEEKYKKQENEIRLKGISASMQVTQKSFLNVYPAFSPDGAKIAYSSGNWDEVPAVYIINPDGSDDKKLIDKVFIVDGLSWSPDGNRLYYTKMDFQNNTNLYNDIYYHSFKNNKEIRMTEGLRAMDPCPSPDGKKLTFVLNKLGMTRLAMSEIPAESGLGIDTDKIIYLNEWSMNQYSDPKFSPDGLKISVSVWQTGGYQDIWIINSETKKIEELSHDRAIDSAPAWSPDGKHIYFSSDRTGVHNIYVYETETAKLFQVTNVIGGAFTPSVSADGGKLAFSSYSSKGFNIHTMEINKALWEEAEEYKDPYPVIEYEEKSVETETYTYNPAQSIYPRYWFPSIEYNSESGMMLGAMTSGQDALERHKYSLSGNYGPKKGRLWYSLDYSYSGFYPDLKFKFSDSDKSYADFFEDNSNHDKKEYFESEKRLDFTAELPFKKTTGEHTFSIGYRFKKISGLSDVPPWPGYNGEMPAEGVLCAGRIGYQFKNSKRFGFSISPERGRNIKFVHEKFNRFFASDYKFDKYTADWNEYINLFENHQVLKARIFSGISTGEIIPQRAFQLGGDFPGDVLYPVDDGETVYLRGYPPNAFRGQKSALATLEYRFPIKNLEKGFDSHPVYFRRVHGRIFSEAGNAWDAAFKGSDFKRGAGFETHFDTYIAYLIPVSLRIGIARGFDKNGETTFYMDMGLTVEPIE